jgi:hypothetical protein
MRRTGEMMLVTLMLGACTTAAEMEGARPAQPPEQIAKDLKGCNDAVVGMGYEGRGQFVAYIAPRGYTATSGD